ncbi:MAG: phage holin family protein [Clostridia bacterium]|nr:phage holin family protein [Clostridia bacterium]
MMANIKGLMCAALGVTGGMVAKLFGGWTEDMVTLIIFMTIDFVMGLVVAGVFHNSTKSKSGALDSRASWKGLCKKCVTLLFVLIAHRLDILLETDYIRTTAIIGFVANEAISIIENAGLMGLPLPAAVTKVIEILKDGEAWQDDYNSAEL